jgi:hypothetical protein
MGIGGGQWVVRYRNKASKPMKLPKAKTYALEMVKGIRPGRMVADPIGRLLRLHLDVLEPMPEMAEIRAIGTADYPPLYSRHWRNWRPQRAAITSLSITLTAIPSCPIV